MKILCVCDQGNNRSVQFAHLLKYWGNETIAAGVKTNSRETLDMLYDWSDTIVITEKQQKELIPTQYEPKILLLDVGPDIYPRPFNTDLHKKAKELLENNKDILKNN